MRDLYRCCVWVKNGQRRVVWRCVSRLDYGSKYCKDSPTIDETSLQNSILTAINFVMSNKAVLTKQISSAISMESVSLPGETMSIADIDRRIAELTQEFDELFSSTTGGDGFKQYGYQFKRITDDTAALKDKRKLLLEQQKSNSTATRRIQDAMAVLDGGSAELGWNEDMIHQLVDTVKVLSPEKIRVYFRVGDEIEMTS